MAFTRGTTPTYTIAFPDIDFSTLTDIYITFEQTKQGVEITKHGDDLAWAADHVSVRLSQADTLKFKAGEIKVQVRAIDNTDNAVASTIWYEDVNDVLYEKVI